MYALVGLMDEFVHLRETEIFLLSIQPVACFLHRNRVTVTPLRVFLLKQAHGGIVMKVNILVYSIKIQDGGDHQVLGQAGSRKLLKDPTIPEKLQRRKVWIAHIYESIRVFALLF